MIPSRVLSLILAALFAAAFRPAPAAAQIGVAGETKADAKPADEAKPKKKAKADGAKAVKAKKKKKADDSKYKSRALADGTEASYHFDADGNPIDAAAKKKGAKSHKSSEDASDEKPAGKDSCSAEEPCVNKSADADAL